MVENKKEKKRNKPVIYKNNSNIINLNIEKLEINNNNINKIKRRRSKTNKSLSIKLNKSGLDQSKSDAKINKLLLNLDIKSPEKIFLRKNKIIKKSAQLDKS